MERPRSVLRISVTRNKFVRVLLILVVMAGTPYVVPPIFGYAHRHFGEWREILAFTHLVGAIASLAAIGIAMNANPLFEVDHGRAVRTLSLVGTGTITSAGIILRRRWGVIALMAVYLLVVTEVLRPRFAPAPFSGPPLPRSVDGEEVFGERFIVLLFLLLFASINGVYFRNRRKLMGATGAKGESTP